MVRLSLWSLLAVFAGAALARTVPEQQVLSDTTAQLTPKWSYTICGSDQDPINIKSIKLSPDSPEPGKDLTITVKGFVNEVVDEGAYANVAVKLGTIKLLQKAFNICEEARHANMTLQCPVEKGDHQVSQTVALPKEIPQAKFGIDVQGYTVDDDELFCLHLDVDFRRNFPW